MAMGTVRVSPGILETKVMVAPNSPKLFANDKMAPAITPGMDNGSVMVRNVRQRLAPSVMAAVSMRRSTASMDRRMARTMRGNPMTAAATAAPVQRKAMDMPTDASSVPK